MIAERVGFCTLCGADILSWDGLYACPACGSKSVPCAEAHQVTVSINWHELRILCIWAENWQREKGCNPVVYAIAKRIAAQHPGRAPLTLAGELGELSKAVGGNMDVTDPKLRQDIASQTGEETGLIILPPRDREGGAA
jgi:predicted RNA-binding Zn-ribbon protein involved in translation (DUF1610 family)